MECKFCGNNHQERNCPFQKISERLDSIENRLKEIQEILLTDEEEVVGK